MTSLTDQQLLLDYIKKQSEPAFAEVVRRHLAWVYSAALRVVVDRHLAEDVTQRTFVALARNARKIARRQVIAGWLHCTTHNFAVMTVRTEERRRAREQNAATMKSIERNQDTAWEGIATHLDQAVSRLSSNDRDAITLHYFEKKTANEISKVLGISMEAAQKRVNRAVERLRTQLRRCGITIPAALLSTEVISHSVQAVPAGLCGTVTTGALMKAALAVTEGATWLPSLHWFAVLRAKPFFAGAAAIAVLTLGAGGFAAGRIASSKHERAVAWQMAMLSSPAPSSMMTVGTMKGTAGDDQPGLALPIVSDVVAEAARHFRGQDADPYAWAKGFTTMERILPDQATQALRELEKYRGEPAVFKSLAPMVMAVWAQSDPRTALSHALGNYKDNTLALSLEFISKAWAQKEPAAAWAWFRETSDAGKVPISAGSWMWVPSFIISEWAARDAVGAFNAFARMPYTEQTNAIHGIAQAALDRDARPAILAAIETLGNESDRLRVAAKVASNWARLNPAEAANWASSVKFENPMARLRVLGEVAEEWWATDPHATAQWLLTNSPPEVLSEARMGLRKMTQGAGGIPQP